MPEPATKVATAPTSINIDGQEFLLVPVTMQQLVDLNMWAAEHHHKVGVLALEVLMEEVAR